MRKTTDGTSKADHQHLSFTIYNQLCSHLIPVDLRPIVVEASRRYIRQRLDQEGFHIFILAKHASS